MRQRPGPRKIKYVCDLRVLRGEALLSVNDDGTIIARLTEMDMAKVNRRITSNDIELEQACLR